MPAWRLPPAGSPFRDNPPFPHCVFNDFLDPALFRSLQNQFPPFDPSQACNELGVTGGKAVFSRVRELGPAYQAFDEIMQSQEFLRALGELTGIPRLLYDPAYIGGGAHLNLSGQDLDLHVDFNFHPRTQTHRRLNLILFLNDVWDPSWGGCLELHADPRDPSALVRMVTPAPNRCAVFETSERSWHGFQRIEIPPEFAKIGRRTLAVYFYTQQRPPAETVPSHGTFYLPRPLPARFQSGYTLTPADLLELQILLGRRDSQITHLYQRELDYSRILHSPTVRMAHTVTAPLRWLRRVVTRSYRAR